MGFDPAKYGPWAVIPGGSEGIGACIATRLAKAGINSVLIARKPEPLEEVAAEVRALGTEARTLAMDLASDDMFDRIKDATADIEVGLLVYNAGASLRTGPFIEWDIADVEQVIRLNVLGQTRLSHHFGKQMAARGRGGIVLMGSPRPIRRSFPKGCGGSSNSTASTCCMSSSARPTRLPWPGSASATTGTWATIRTWWQPSRSTISQKARWWWCPRCRKASTSSPTRTAAA
jgi:NAD(P)-dependent dehydrogenase (short-subunit alcohol dehydrogenase family)